ncbi:MAG: hypothetical protein R3E52_10140 [Burkholderiaceae bacterium]
MGSLRPSAGWWFTFAFGVRAGALRFEDEPVSGLLQLGDFGFLRIAPGFNVCAFGLRDQTDDFGNVGHGFVFQEMRVFALLRRFDRCRFAGCASRVQGLMGCIGCRVPVNGALWVAEPM